MDITELLKWIPQGGAAGAVITVVWMFLKQQDQMATLMLAITDKFHASLDRIQEESDRRIDAMLTKSEEQHMDMQEKLTELVKEQIAVNTKMTLAIDSLQHAVLDLQHRG